MHVRLKAGLPIDVTIVTQIEMGLGLVGQAGVLLAGYGGKVGWVDRLRSGGGRLFLNVWRETERRLKVFFSPSAGLGKRKAAWQ